MLISVVKKVWLHKKHIFFLIKLRLFHLLLEKMLPNFKMTCKKTKWKILYIVHFYFPQLNKLVQSALTPPPQKKKSRLSRKLFKIFYWDVKLSSVFKLVADDNIMRLIHNPNFLLTICFILSWCRDDTT